MTVIVPEPFFREDQPEEESNGSLNLDGGFVVPEINVFGHSFRDYEKESERKASMEEFYKKNLIHQTLEFATKKKEMYGKLNRAEMSIWECCELLNEFVDESDPDLDEPQIEHLLQTAEAIRRDYPNEDWLHLTALIHDLGKVLLLPEFGGEAQWCVVGDTFPLGCAFDEAIVHHQEQIEKKNLEVREKVQAQLGRVEEEIKRLAEIREEAIRGVENRSNLRLKETTPTTLLANIGRAWLGPFFAEMTKTRDRVGLDTCIVRSVRFSDIQLCAEKTLF